MKTNLDLFQFALERLSENTQKGYAQDIKTFGRWWKTETPIQDLITFRDPVDARVVVLQFQADMLKQGLSTATVARYVHALNSIVKKLNFAGFVDWKLEVPAVKIEKKDVRGPTASKWKKLLHTVEMDDRWIGARDLAMLRLMGNDNLRASEVSNLRYPDDLQGGEVFVHGKGGKNVWHPIHAKSRATLIAWTKTRAKILGDRDVPWLFFTKEYQRLGGKRVWACVVQRANEAQIGIVNPNGLRHYAITEKAKSWNGPQAALTHWARHSDANMTQRYIDEVRDEVFQISQLGDADD